MKLATLGPILVLCLAGAATAVPREQTNVVLDVSVRRQDSDQDQVKEKVSEPLGKKATIHVPSSSKTKDDSFSVTLTGRQRDSRVAIELNFEYHSSNLMTSLEFKNSYKIKFAQEDGKTTLMVLDRQGNITQLVPLSQDWDGLMGTSVTLDCPQSK